VTITNKTFDINSAFKTPNSQIAPKNLSLSCWGVLVFFEQLSDDSMQS